MINSLKWDNLCKFLISIGVFLIIAPLVGVYYISSNLSNKLISKANFENLSSFSKDLLNNERTLRNIIEMSSAFLIVIGFCLMFCGGKYWYNLQKKEDTVSDAERNKKLESMNEAVSFANKKVLTSNEENEDSVITNRKNIVGKDDYTSLDNDNLSFTKAPDISRENHRKHATPMRVMFGYLSEQYYLKVLEDRFSGNYRIESSFESDRFFDAVAISQNTSTDILFEIKTFYGTNVVSSKSIERVLNQFRKINAEYAKEIGREYILNLVVICHRNQMQSLKRSILKLIKSVEWSEFPIQVEYTAAEDVEEFMIDKER